MIGFIEGTVQFSDGQECILRTSSGIGYSVSFNQVLIEGSYVAIYVTHIIKEDAQSLYGFSNLRAKKLFELLLTVKGVGPKSAFSLMYNLTTFEIINAIKLESKQLLTKVPGIGNKSAAQMILDLSGKIDRVKMYSNKLLIAKAKVIQSENHHLEVQQSFAIGENQEKTFDQNLILNDTLMACKELGFREDRVIPLAQKILASTQISKPEQLVHLVLREL